MLVAMLIARVSMGREAFIILGLINFVLWKNLNSIVAEAVSQFV